MSILFSIFVVEKETKPQVPEGHQEHDYNREKEQRRRSSRHGNSQQPRGSLHNRRRNGRRRPRRRNLGLL